MKYMESHLIHTENLNPIIIQLGSLLLWENPILESFSSCQTRETLKNYTKIALVIFHCSILLCKSDFQITCDFAVLFSATNCHSEWSLKIKV